MIIKLWFSVLIISIILIGVLLYFLNFKSTQDILVTDCKPTFVDGGGPYYKPSQPFRENIAPENSKGIQLSVSGKILLNDCITPVKNAVLDIWQANESGSYNDQWYRGRVKTDNNGNYRFLTVIPKGYGQGTAFRPPHIHFKVWVDDRQIITSQMFFPESKGKPGFDNAYIMKMDLEKGEATHPIILP